eukprot:gene2087-2443_t
MLIPLIVTISVFVHVCSASYDVAFTRLTDNQAAKATRLLTSAIFSNGDLLVGGYTAGLTDFPSAGGIDFLMQRYSYSGTLLWTKVFGGIKDENMQKVAVDSSDNIYVTGFTKSESAAGDADVYIGKFDSS